MSRTLLSDNPTSKVSVVESIYYQSVFRNEGPKHVVMKVLKSEWPTHDEIAQFYNEFEILKEITHPKIRKVYKKIVYRGKHTIFFEWINGKAIRKIGRVANIHLFLSFAIQITSALRQVHAHQVVHGNVTADNIIVNLTTGEIKLIDFGSSVRIKGGPQDSGEGYQFEVISCYSSPEQAGNLQRMVDYRSDLYSLGVVFYFMLSGKLPFQSTEKEELNRPPTPLDKIDPNIPAPLSSLVRKLMNRIPEDRYQSAKGLLFDLRSMLEQIKSNGRIATDLRIGDRDFTGRLQFSKELYGREKELKTLLEAFGRVQGGNVEVVSIAGSAGTGKSALVQQFANKVTEKGGHFVCGKYDHLQQDKPYSAILQAFDDLCALLLESDQSKIDHFRALIQEAVGSEGKLLTDVMPKLRVLIGIQAEVGEVGLLENKLQFSIVLRKFIFAISGLGQGIVLFVDDLQWADSESIHLLSDCG